MRTAVPNPWIDAAMASAVRVTRARLLSGVVVVGIVLSAAAAQADEIRGTVLRVADGDTILVLTTDSRRRSIRIVGIDAPESAQPFGRESRESLARLVAGGEVRAECPKPSGSGGLVCNVWARPTDCATCAQTINVGLAQIAAGMAWWYRRYAMEQVPEVRARYEAEEQTARAHKRGLWADAKPVPPWDWRRAR